VTSISPTIRRSPPCLLDKAIAGCLADEVPEIRSLGNTLESHCATGDSPRGVLAPFKYPANTPMHITAARLRSAYRRIQLDITGVHWGGIECRCPVAARLLHGGDAALPRSSWPC